MTGGGGVPDFAFPEKNAIFTPNAPIRQKTHAMYRLSQYKETDKIGDLICENYPILLVVSRFGISLGFGDKDIAQVCADNGVDTPTFLAVVNLLLDEDESAAPADAPLSVGALVRYLQNSHAYFLDFRLPVIRRELADALGSDHGDVSFAVLRFFDEYAAEVRRHMLYEEEKVFPYVRSLLEGRKKGRYRIDIFRRQHDQVEARLTELKNILIRYYPGSGSNELNSALFDIFSCERDLASHNRIEDHLFVPAVVELERKNGSQ